jgi:hypothetical protein
MIQRYRSRISGRVLDRIDIHIIDIHLEVPAAKYRELTDRSSGEPSAAVRERVNRARALRGERFRGASFFCNAQMGARQLHAHYQLEPAGERLLELAINLSARVHADFAGRADDGGSRRGRPDPGPITRARRSSTDRSARMGLSQPGVCRENGRKGFAHGVRAMVRVDKREMVA